VAASATNVGARRLGGFVLLASALALVGVAIIPLIPGSSERGDISSAYAAGDPVTCAVPTDISLLFDRSGSMASPASKLTNAKSAAISFINAFAGGPSDNDLSPHQMAGRERLRSERWHEHRAWTHDGAAAAGTAA
jgi:hypothetical protein